jgi:hypothetical protein
MEIDGHPTQDLIEELERRGALRLDGTTSGPSAVALRFLAEGDDHGPGFWLFLPHKTFLTGFDEPP